MNQQTKYILGAPFALAMTMACTTGVLAAEETAAETPEDSPLEAVQTGTEDILDTSPSLSETGETEGVLLENEEEGALEEEDIVEPVEEEAAGTADEDELPQTDAEMFEEDDTVQKDAAVITRAETADAIAKGETLSVETNGITSTLDCDVLNSLKDNETVTLNVGLVDEDDWDPIVQLAMEMNDWKVAAVIQADLFDESGNAIHDLNGTITVNLGKDIVDTSENSVVFYFSPEGDVEALLPSMDEEGNVLVSLTHFSRYYIVQDVIFTNDEGWTEEDEGVIVINTETAPARPSRPAKPKDKDGIRKTETVVKTGVNSTLANILSWLTIAICGIIALFAAKSRLDKKD